MTLKVIHRLQAFPNAIRRTFVQHVTRFQLKVCSRDPSALAELLVFNCCKIMLQNVRFAYDIFLIVGAVGFCSAILMSFTLIINVV